MDERGTLGNFINGTMNGYATSVYRIDDAFVMGSRVFASWSTVPGNAPSRLFYDVDGEAGMSHALVEGIACSTSSTSHAVLLSGEANGQLTGKEWGSAVECEVGPRLLNASANESPPTIILSSGTDVHVIVEEESSYPSFLYSVWQSVSSGDASNASEPMEMHHVFYVSSTTRLAEAIVSGVVNGIMSGGGCVDLLSQFSMTNTTYNLSGMSRVTPFGEYPNFSSVESIDQVEAIVAGVKVNNIGTICGLILMVVTGVSFVGCLGSTRSRKTMDVFDRDAVIRAVAIPNGGQEADITSPALKIYVRKSDDRFGMVVSDDTASRRWIRGCIKRLSPGGAESPSVGDEDEDGDDDAVPVRGISRSWSLPRASFSRLSSDRPSVDERNQGDGQGEVPTPVRTPVPSPTYVELVASPIPSLVRRGSRLRGLPTFFSASMTASRGEDSGTEQAHSGMTDQGHLSPGTSSRSPKATAASVLRSALDGKEAPPDDDADASKPAVVPSLIQTASSSKSALAPEHVGPEDERRASGNAVDIAPKANIIDGGESEVSSEGVDADAICVSSQSGASKCVRRAESTSRDAKIRAGEPICASSKPKL